MFNKAVAIIEAHRDAMMDEINSTEAQYCECPCCEQIYREDDQCWFLPHACALELDDDNERYVCSDNCKDHWLTTHWEELEEHEYKQEEQQNGE